jgi:hypothetical protein
MRKNLQGILLKPLVSWALGLEVDMLHCFVGTYLCAQEVKMQIPFREVRPLCNENFVAVGPSRVYHAAERGGPEWKSWLRLLATSLSARDETELREVTWR